ncbi:MAG: restriction endonuclease subunit S [Candidatus Competibacteraceae bacterium]|nr:restriction endonuclease subunit S [Candidatus Competibacteraceae bacterium]
MTVFKPVKLKPHIRQIRGIAFKPSEVTGAPFDGSIAILKANNITDTGLDDSSLIYIDARKVKKDQLIKSGDILLAASSGSKKVIEKNIYFHKDYLGTFGAFCKLVRPKPELHPEYLKHFFKTVYYRNAIERSVQGVNINNLKNEHLDNLEIPLPLLNDQIRIAHLLSKVERLIAQRKPLFA